MPAGIIEVGDSIRAAGRPGRRGRASVFSFNILLEDGREILVNDRSTPRWTENTIGRLEEAARRDDASSGIFGVWSALVGFDGDVEAGVWGGDIELTAEAVAIRDQFDPAGGNNPFLSCTRGIPEIMTGLGPLEFVDQGDQILFRFEEFDIVRPIMMGPDAEANRPPKSATRSYGDERPGNNLYGNSLVCVDARTGEMVWYFQLIHHDLWDWDTPTVPILMDIVVDGVEIPAVAQVTKQAWVYAFNRVTGEPVWPIEERPVPAGDVPGEWYEATQTIPTKPAPFDRQGFTEDDIIDFTPEFRAEAMEGLQAVRMGPMYSPPSLANHSDGTSGTLTLPSVNGGANWEAASFDPETGMLYIGSFTRPELSALVPSDDGKDIPYEPGGAAQLPWLSGLPVVKPPWGRITAIDMNTGEHAWMRPNGPTPEDVINNPALAGIDIPETGSQTRAMLLATKTLLFGTHGTFGTPYLRSCDKATGELIAEVEIPGASTGLPMTYAINGKQYIALPVSGEHGAQLVALTLPD